MDIIVIIVSLITLSGSLFAQSQIPTTTWVGTQNYAALPSGVLMLLLSGSCPTGWTESSALNGKFLQGTLAANGDVGTTGGNATITPAGSVTAPTFTGSQVTTSAVSAGTPAGTNGTAAFTPAVTNSAPTFTGNAGTVPAEIFTGSALGTHTHTDTAAGTNSVPTFTGNAVDPRPAFVKVIFCSKN